MLIENNPGRSERGWNQAAEKLWTMQETLWEGHKFQPVRLPWAGIEPSGEHVQWAEPGSAGSTLSLNTKAFWDQGIKFLEVVRKNGWISTAYMEYLLFAANTL